ncbi:MAG: OmpH family outer membrane protein [Lysobacteraceae bacterium]|nr:MAG: OmpH family outer membrane protein [Xanthomonadaceae bacterium]
MTQHVNQAARMLALLLAMLPAAAFAQDAAVRIGYVDMKRLLDNAPQVVSGRTRLEREFAARDAALQSEEKRAEELRARLAAAAAGDADALRREVDALDRSIKRKRDGLRNDLKTRSDQELDRSWREINEAVVEFAREQGYDLIVPSPVVYASPKADVTERILDRLRRQSAGATP